jgi:murein DD-endopeptidase MepM/ murein hydrolase activator NlpD
MGTAGRHRRLVTLLAAALAGALFVYGVTRFEGTPPQMTVPDGPLSVGGAREVSIRVQDNGTGLETVRVWVERKGSEYELFEERYPGGILFGGSIEGVQELTFVLHAKDLGLDDGPAVLRVEARDFSWRGNRATADIPIRIDTRPPRITVATGLTYVRRGGAELAVYRIAEPSTKHGVQIGKQFFPGYTHPSDPQRFVALYAVPHDVLPDFRAEVIAFDRAENRAAVPLSVSLIERGFKEDSVRLPDSFMERKLAELLPGHDGPVLDGYLEINRGQRRLDAERIREICDRSTVEKLWERPFLQLPNSKVNATFAERRSYMYNGRKVDSQVHLGYDLASTTRASVPASNDGTVTFAGTLGIYGETVIIDHGLGLFSLYGHLSEIGVEEGQPVSRGEPVGRTGTTGLAGGDHLHFSMLVHGVFVDPLEWFDGRWIREHVEAKLGNGRGDRS